MAYGILKCDTVTFTDAGIDKSVSISGLVQNPTFSGNVTVTGTLSGVTVTGTTANFVSGVFSSQLSGTTVTGTTASFTSGVFTDISGGTHTITSGVFAAGSNASPSISFTSDPDTGLYSPGANQVALSTSGTGRLFVDSSGNVGIGTSSPTHNLTIGSTAASDFVLSLRGGVGGFLGWDDSANCTILQAPNTRSLQFRVNSDTFSAGTMAMHINSSGNVGIGTTSPTAPLCVQGAANSDQLIVTGSNGLSRGLKISTGVDFANDSLVKYDSQYVSGADYGAHAFLTGGQERLRLDRFGRLLVGTISDSGGALLQVNGNRIRVATAKTPASASDTGTTGEICWDASYIYVCTATNTWKRAALSTW